MAKLPQHPYRTRANYKRMEDWGEAQESIKSEICQLKDQIGQILETLVALKSTKDIPVVRNEEATSFNPVAS